MLGLVAQLALEPAAFGDVEDLADEVQRLAVLVAHERDRDERPHLGPVLVPVTLLHLVRGNLFRDQPAQLLDVVAEVVLGAQLLEGGRQHLLLGVADDLAEGAVDLEQLPLQRDHVDADRRVIEGQLEAALGLRQARRVLSLGGHVGERRHDRERRPFLGQPAGRDAQPASVAVLATEPEHAIVDLDAGCAGDLGGQRVVYDGPALLVDELPAKVAQRGLVGRVEQVGEDRLGGVVGVQAPSVRADDVTASAIRLTTSSVRCSAARRSVMSSTEPM